MKIFDDLSVSIIADKFEIPINAYKHLLTNGSITSESQAINILAFAKSSVDLKTQDPRILLENAIFYLNQFSDSIDDDNKINLLIEQIKLLRMSKHRRSSPSYSYRFHMEFHQS